MIVNMIVDLAGQTFVTLEEPSLLAAAGVDLLNREGATPDEVNWIRKTFRGRWHDEAVASWNWFATAKSGTAGFAAYGQRTFRWWWLEKWWDRPDIGIFGPMGVSKKFRGMHVGVVLARRALASLQAMGYAQAIIPAVGPIKFYERYCGARVIERLRRPSNA
jgi:hypothetical protein